MGQSRQRALGSALAFALLTATAVVVLATASGAGRIENREGNGLRLAEVARFDQPTFVGAPRGAGDVAYVTEREGRIRILDGDREGGTFLDIRRRVGCCEVESGLFSVAFPPDYERSGRFYVYFTNRHDNIEVDEFRRSRSDPLRARGLPAQDHRDPPEG